MISRNDLQSFIRSNGYAWPGGYPCVLMMADGEVIDAQSARENYRLIRRGFEPDWQASGILVHWEGEPLRCAHSGRLIESAYGTNEE